MSKTIKIIDLLNKIANGEEVPKKLIFQDREYIKDDNNDFMYIDKDYMKIHLFNDLDYINNMLNDEVEIIEEPEEINIQDIQEMVFNDMNANIKNESNLLINQLIKAVKYLDNKLEEK